MLRFLAMTHNLWGEARWPDRRPALQALLELRRPDIYAVQHLRPSTCKVIDTVLGGHERVHDSFEGWERQTNIWWDQRIFQVLEHGVVDIGLAVSKSRIFRRLFWVRLRTHSVPTDLLVATAHLTPPGYTVEVTDHVNPRIAQSEAAAEALRKLGDRDQPCLFMGDLNETIHPLRVLHANGWVDSFTALHMTPTPTCPVGPTRYGDPAEPEAASLGTPRVIDFQLHRGPVRPLMTEVVDFFERDLAPSDHRPVATVYALD